LLLCGLDEAGRGSVVGPLVVAACLIEEGEQGILEGMGVADSKTLTPNRREELFGLVTSVSKKWRVVTLEPARVNDALRKKGISSLNRLEAQTMAELLNSLRPTVAVIDSPDRNTKRFQRAVEDGLEVKTKLVCQNKADVNHPVVSAASILAKVTRDRALVKLRETYGDIGSGYPSDAKTILFIKRCIRSGSLPNIVRANWETIAKAKQLRLEEFE